MYAGALLTISEIPIDALCSTVFDYDLNIFYFKEIKIYYLSEVQSDALANFQMNEEIEERIIYEI